MEAKKCLGFWEPSASGPPLVIITFWGGGHLILFSIVCYRKVGLCFLSEKDIDIVCKVHLFYKYTKNT